MFVIYSLLLTVGFIVLLPRFLFDAIFNGKYAAGFAQRLGFLPEFEPNVQPVLWLHCVSVGEVNAARPLVDAIKNSFPDHRLIVSTTTKTGQTLARDIFKETAEVVFYFPFDWKFSVRRSLARFKPAAILLMETEIWFRFIREAYKSGARLAIVNGRLSEKSFKRYGYIKRFMRRVLGYLDLALMQGKTDAKRLMSLGVRGNKVKVTGNLKFDHRGDEQETELTGALRERFGITKDAPLIIASSSHAPEEKWILEAFKEVWKKSKNNLPRLLIAPRHPERFDEVAALVNASGFNWVRRTETESGRDKTAEIILLDSIGELRAAYPLAEIVFVGGSLIPHGGQSILEPAAAGKAIVTGFYTMNFDAAVKEFLGKHALIQLPKLGKKVIVAHLADVFGELLSNPEKRKHLESNSLAVMNRNRGATAKMIENLTPMLMTPRNQ